MSKVIVITGASAGLGRALARRFVADGEQVVLLGRSLARLQPLADELGDRALPVECDVSSPEAVNRAFATIAEAHPHVDILINNAVFYQPFLVTEASDEQILATIGTNLMGPVLCSRAVVPLMRKGSHIINVSSESVTIRFPHLVVYQASKAGLERFSEGLHHELDPLGIKVTTVRAGSMYEEGKGWDVDPEARMRFAKAAMEVGINLRERVLTHYSQITDVFRALIDLPENVQAGLVTLHARGERTV